MHLVSCYPLNDIELGSGSFAPSTFFAFSAEKRDTRGGATATLFDQFLYYDDNGNLALLATGGAVTIYSWQKRADDSWFVSGGNVFASGYVREVGLGADS